MPTLALPGAWQSCADAFLTSTYERSGSHKSRATYLSLLCCFYRDPARDPASYTRNDVIAFLASKSTSNRNPGADVSVSTRNSRLTALSSFYKFASDYEVSKDVPLFPGKAPTVGIVRSATEIKYRALSTAELLRFFAAIPTDTPKGIRDRAIYLVYFWTARRRMEIARLCYGDIEPATFPDEMGNQRSGYVYHYQGKGHARQTKTKELPPQAWAALDSYLVASGRKDTIQASDPLFTSMYPKAKKGVHPSYLNKQFKQYAEVAGLDTERVSLHSLRHSASRERRSAGQKIEDIKELLDHSSLQTTFTYLALVAGTEDKGAALLSSRFAQL